jgi:hypothetical protein
MGGMVIQVGRCFCTAGEMSEPVVYDKNPSAQIRHRGDELPLVLRRDEVKQASAIVAEVSLHRKS